MFTTLVWNVYQCFFTNGNTKKLCSRDTQFTGEFKLPSCKIKCVHENDQCLKNENLKTTNMHIILMINDAQRTAFVFSIQFNSIIVFNVCSQHWNFRQKKKNNSPSHPHPSQTTHPSRPHSPLSHTHIPKS
jgi:hypothetical protein